MFFDFPSFVWAKQDVGQNVPEKPIEKNFCTTHFSSLSFKKWLQNVVQH